MIQDITRYHDRLIRDQIARRDGCAFVAKSVDIETIGNELFVDLATALITHLPHTAITIAAPEIPFINLLIQREGAQKGAIAPRDSETRGFLHEIPYLTSTAYQNTTTADIAELLTIRKGMIIEGVGIIGTGAITVEQAYITASSIFHALFIKYLHDVITEGIESAKELPVIEAIIDLAQPITLNRLTLSDTVPQTSATARAEIIKTGRALVEAGLVDSFFGNISCVTDTGLLISQTGASLDELQGQLDPIPFDDSSTAGITASSELPAHIAIVKATDAMVVLHGHPRFTVAMSLLCDIEGCTETRCWQHCPHKRKINNVPIVSGETGIGGIAKTLPPAMSEHGLAVVYGHGSFAIGSMKQDNKKSGVFAEAFDKIAVLENYCRQKITSKLHDLIDC